MEQATLNDNDLIKKSILEIRNLKKQLADVKGDLRSPIAIVGVGCELPGGSNSPEKYWEFLSSKGDAMSPPPKDRWSYANQDNIDFDKPAFQGGYLDYDPVQFDPLFFNIPPKEAKFLDPQHRLFLEVTWRSLHNAGIDPESLTGSKTGVFCGITGGDYLQLLMKDLDPEQYSMYVTSGNCNNFIAGRVSYILGLKGPSLAIDTACSSSLVAIHSACQSLRNRECDLAIAGGVSLMLSPNISKVLINGKMLSPDGRCKTFDESANGYARGEGCGAIVLKRLADVDEQADKVLAVIKDSSVQHDGKKSGLTVPLSGAQKMLMNEVISGAQIDPLEVSYCEAHGTGTSLGDPIELEAINAVYGQKRDTENPLYIGSVKANIGHLEAAAGVAGVIKAALAIHHQKIPPHINCKHPNSHFDWNNADLTIVRENTSWPTGKKRLASVSSFGASGTNAHIILEESTLTNDAIKEPEANSVEFDKMDCWYKEIDKPVAAEGASESAFKDYDVMKAEYNFPLHISSVPTIVQHRIFDTVVLTGSIYLELTLSITQNLFGDGPMTGYRFQNVTLLKPIIFEEDEIPLRAVIEKVEFHESSNLYRVKMYPGDTQGEDVQDMYSSIDIEIIPDVKAPATNVDIQALIGQCTDELDKELFYGDFWGSTFTIGEKFHIFDKVWRKDAELAVGVCRPVDFLNKTNGYNINPESIIAYLNGLLFKGALPEGAIKDFAAQDKAFIGTGYDSCTFYETLAKDVIYCVAEVKQRSDDGTQFNGEATLYDEQGKMLCQMENIAFSVVDKESVPSLPETGRERSLAEKNFEGHPILGKKFSKIGSWTCETVLEYDTYPLIGDHTTFDYALFPALGYMHLALNAIRNIKPDFRFTHVENLKVAQPIMLYPDDVYKIRTKVDKKDEHNFDYNIYCFADKKNLINKDWGLSSGAEMTDLPAVKPEVASFSPQEVADYDEKFTTKEFFDYFWGEEFILGPSYHFIEDVWRRPDEALCVIRSFDNYKEKMGIWDVPANFLQIYMSLPLAMATVPNEYIEKVRKDGATCIAATVQKFVIYDDNNGEQYDELWAQAVIRNKENIDEKWESDFKYFNQQGELVAEVEGVVFKILQKQALDLLKQSMEESETKTIDDQLDVESFLSEAVSKVIEMDVSKLKDSIHVGQLMDSIMALELRNKIEKEMSILLPLHDIAEAASIKELADQVKQRAESAVQ